MKELVPPNPLINQIERSENARDHLAANISHPPSINLIERNMKSSRLIRNWRRVWNFT